MCSKNTTSFIGKIGLLLSFVMVLFLVADASAQCVCKKTSSVKRKKAARTTVYAVRQPVRAYSAPTRTRYIVVRNGNGYVNGNGYTNGSRVYTVNPVTIDNYGEIIPDADYRETRRIARDYGYRDGWEDGEDAGMERDAYHPQNSGDYQKAANGYEDTFGSKRVYKEAYREAYLRGYRAGYRSVANRNSLRAVRW